jgi:large subunit ribosomal protein L23
MTKAIDPKYYDIIRRPLITEKATLHVDQSKYSFEVASSANKIVIKDAVEAIFDVKVKQVNIVNIQGKRKYFKGREGFRSDLKKAIVTLEKGQTLDFTAGV